jgi:hypothetical protein
MLIFYFLLKCKIENILAMGCGIVAKILCTHKFVGTKIIANSPNCRYTKVCSRQPQINLFLSYRLLILPHIISSFHIGHSLAWVNFYFGNVTHWRSRFYYICRMCPFPKRVCNTVYVFVIVNFTSIH